MSNSNCKSINLIYIIYCNKCLYYYIGQTNNFRNRFNAHKRNILLSIFDENSLNDVFELYKHFSLPYHSLKDNFNFYIFKDNVNLLNDRLNYESQLLNLFLKLKVPLLNSRSKITNKYHYKNHL